MNDVRFSEKENRQRGMSLGMAYCNGTTCKFIIEMILAISSLHSFGPAPGLGKTSHSACG
jgi:hypothetical protein